MKNTIIIMLLVVLGLSLGYNYILWKMHGDYLNEESRLKKSSYEMKLIGFPTDIFNKEQEQFNSLPETEQDTVIKVMNKTIIDMFHLLEEVINNSGGIEPDTYFYSNPYAIAEVNNYFYEDNNWRNKAIEYFEQSTDEYFQLCQKHDIQSQINRTMKFREEQSPGRLFEKMTLSETVLLLEGICYIITIDKKNYKLRKTHANNGEHP